MTPEEKQLLLKDLCARLPYNVHCCVYTMNGKVREEDDILYEVRTLGENVQTLKLLNEHPDECLMIYQVKPYLRPMSSMTDEEREEWADLFNLELDKLNEIDDENKAEELAPYYFGKSHQVSIDWLNKNMFDYRGLIPMGLALEAKEGMYES